MKLKLHIFLHLRSFIHRVPISTFFFFFSSFQNFTEMKISAKDKSVEKITEQVEMGMSLGWRRFVCVGKQPRPTRCSFLLQGPDPRPSHCHHGRGRGHGGIHAEAMAGQRHGSGRCMEGGLQGLPVLPRQRQAEHRHCGWVLMSWWGQMILTHYSWVL